jgi:hypothetical protein
MPSKDRRASPESGDAYLPLCANDSVVLIEGIRVHLDGTRSGPVTILPILLDAGDPELVARTDIDVIAADAMCSSEGAGSVVHGPTGLREPHPTNPRRPVVTVSGLQLDVHHPWPHGTQWCQTRWLAERAKSAAMYLDNAGATDQPVVVATPDRDPDPRKWTLDVDRDCIDLYLSLLDEPVR